MTDISPNTQAILMLVAPLMAGGTTDSKLLLTHREYTYLVKTLQQINSQPADLLDRGMTSGILDKLEGHQFDRERLKRLLGRGMQLGLALEHWQQRSIQVISRADDMYPQRLKKTIQHQAPAVLYICGDVDLLQSGGLAVVGSRHVDANLLDYARNVGALAAGADCTIVSGGAKGIDQAVMQGAAAAGGSVIGVLANNLEAAVMRNRNDLMNGMLLLSSPFDPAARFEVWRAMDRNKLIYALSDIALVVESDVGKGGTWQGAVEQIQKLKVGPVYTRTSGPNSAGLKELRKLGAHSWPEFDDETDLRKFMQAIRKCVKSIELPLFSQHIVSKTESSEEFIDAAYIEALADSPDRSDALMVEESTASLHSFDSPLPLPVSQESSRQAQDLTWKERLFMQVEDIILQVLDEQGPLTRDDMAIHLGIAKGQTDSWLRQLENADKIEKIRNPTRYQIKQSEQMSLSRPPAESAASPISPVAER